MAGLFVSGDSGVSWTQASTVIPEDLLSMPQGGTLVGTETSGIFLFTDNGDSVTTLNEGLTDLHVHAFAMDSSGYVYVGTSSGIWRRPVSDLIVSVNPVTNRVPTEFLLHQNYPNPFNPSTTIKFELPKSSEVRLSAYDMLGREVSVLVDERRDAGVHEVKFDGSRLASGVYFYRLQAGDYVASKKMLVLK